ncbi:MAG TPA: hypothetical protein VHA34_07395, partial [Actinomycetes bacterium]|nr:hypothetical protein [Actinomycetes bacterium]
MGEALSRQELEAAHCWEADDRVPRRPAMTGFRRRLRYHQARWREANGHPIGSQPIAPRADEAQAGTAEPALGGAVVEALEGLVEGDELAGLGLCEGHLDPGPV